MSLRRARERAEMHGLEKCTFVLSCRGSFMVTHVDVRALGFVSSLLYGYPCFFFSLPFVASFVVSVVRAIIVVYFSLPSDYPFVFVFRFGVIVFIIIITVSLLTVCHPCPVALPSFTPLSQTRYLLSPLFSTL